MKYIRLISSVHFSLRLKQSQKLTVLCVVTVKRYQARHYIYQAMSETISTKTLSTYTKNRYNNDEKDKHHVLRIH
jgi:hypothetical protein